MFKFFTINSFWHSRSFNSFMCPSDPPKQWIFQLNNHWHGSINPRHGHRKYNQRMMYSVYHPYSYQIHTFNNIGISPWCLYQMLLYFETQRFKLDIFHLPFTVIWSFLDPMSKPLYAKIELDNAVVVNGRDWNWASLHKPQETVLHHVCMTSIWNE